MDPLYTFGFKLAELINQKEFAGVGLLCLAIKDSGKATNGMGYEDYKQVFLNYLPRRLSTVRNINANVVVSEMVRTLNQNQSIFVLSAH